MTRPVATGLDVLQSQNYAQLKGKQVGLLTHPAAVNHDLISAYELLTAAPGLSLRAIFSPEHGLRGVVGAGEKVDNLVDPRTNTVVYSLYGDTLRPTADMFKDIEVLVIDLQDIGVRYYTFMWTMTIVLEAAGEYGIPVLLLDRPNPLGGERICGPPVAPGFESFVGRLNVPVIHGMTIGEMAQWFNSTQNPAPAELTVIPCAGLTRAMVWRDTGHAFVPTSPGMTHISTVEQYPGSCLVEGTTLSEGRGTTLPFEIIGAPWLDGEALAERLNFQKWPGVRFRAHYFSPLFNKHAGQECGGVQAHLTGEKDFNPTLVWLGVISILRQGFPQVFQWLPPQNRQYHFDRLIGSDAPRLAIERGASLKEISADWLESAEAFRNLRREYLIYPEGRA